MNTRCLPVLVLALAVSAGAPVCADSFLAYTQGGTPVGSDIFTWCDTGQPCDLANIVACGTPEGGTFLRMNTNLWAGFGVFLNIDGLGDPQPEDLSAFANADMKFWVKAPKPDEVADIKVEFQCRPATSDVTYTQFLSDHGWAGDDTWQEISIPIADFFAPDPVDMDCLSTVISPFMATIADLPFFNTFRIDYARWETPNSNPGASSIQVQGRQLVVNGEPFVVNAMAYAPISIGDNWQGAWRDRADRYSVDFPLIAASGANAVRLYAPILSKAMLDAAWAEGLYVIPTFGVDEVQLTCAEGKSALQDRFVEAVNQWKDHPAILAWLVGNEVNVNLGSADVCADWYPTLDAMAQAAHAAEGPAFHPIGTATADNGLADVCIPGCSDDTSISNVDFWGLQVYRGCTFGPVFDDYAAKADCDRPLVITEFGSDAYNRPGGAPGNEDQTMQADCIESLLAEADQELNVRTPSGVSSGQVIFSWTDEWWKAECEPTTSWLAHDTCASFTNGAYPDPNIHEEWWGIASVTDVDPDARDLRTSHDRVTASWYLGSVCDMSVLGHDEGTGDTTISFNPGAGSSNHTLHYGPLSAVSTYGYTGSVGDLGATGSGTVTLPPGELFWVVAARTNGAEGCYGKDSIGNERPCFPDGVSCSLPQATNRNCDTCPSP